MVRFWGGLFTTEALALLDSQTIVTPRGQT